jgi:hypothetical protein
MITAMFIISLNKFLYYVKKLTKIALHILVTWIFNSMDGRMLGTAFLPQTSQNLRDSSSIFHHQVN